jgi:hypothetical protein
MTALNIRVEKSFKRRLEARAKGQHRDVSDQARRYLELAMIAEDNPDLPFGFIQSVLEGKAEMEAGLAEPVDWSVK